MKRHLSVYLLTCAAAALTLGCTAAAEESAEIATEAVSENAAEVPEETAGDLSDDLYSFQFKLDGEVYSLPMSYADFISKGWTCDDDESMEIQPNAYGMVTFQKGELEVYADAINLTINTVPLSESSIGGLSMDEWQHEKAPETTFELPGGITYGQSTLDDITAAYGTPSDTYEGDLYTKVTYEYDFYQEIELYVSTETNTLNEVDIRNFVEDKESNAAAAAEVSDEPTPEVLAYEAPSELGSDPLSFIVDFAGDLYQMPAPVSVFEENGWTIKTESSDSVVAGKSFGWVYMMKDNQEYHAIARNYNANATTIKNCFLTSVEGNVNDCNLPIIIPSGVTLGMTAEEAEAALDGFTYEKDDTTSDMFTYYTIESPDSTLDNVEILLHKEDNAVTGIEVSYEPKTLE
ncbi:MAG: hypothetical protein Q4F83_01245 [Eubacteriales bacterium]|nr:hypothetical protein [Eubacteriales bacterium]